MEIFGNKNVTEKVSYILNSKRVAHSFLLYGEKGLGKKTLAKYIAMKLLCTNENAPCGECFHCRNILNNTHPDVVWAEHSGKTNSIVADTVRKIAVVHIADVAAQNLVFDAACALVFEIEVMLIDEAFVVVDRVFFPNPVSRHIACIN